MSVPVGEKDAAGKIIDAVPRRHPLEIRYSKVESIYWESCTRVLDPAVRRLRFINVWSS